MKDNQQSMNHTAIFTYAAISWSDVVHLNGRTDFEHAYSSAPQSLYFCIASSYQT